MIVKTQVSHLYKKWEKNIGHKTETGFCFLAIECLVCHKTTNWERNTEIWGLNGNDTFSTQRFVFRKTKLPPMIGVNGKMAVKVSETQGQRTEYMTRLVLETDTLQLSATTRRFIRKSFNTEREKKAYKGSDFSSSTLHSRSATWKKKKKDNVKGAHRNVLRIRWI